MPRVRIDPHAHLYDCYPLRGWVEAALRNLGVASDVCGAVVIVDRAGQDSFERLRREVPLFGDWNERVCREAPGGAGALVGEVVYQGRALCVIQGVQYSTSERLEVLGLGVSRTIDDGGPCEYTIDRIRADGGVACVPWSPGKWLGGRGAVVARIIKKYSPGDLVFGDISIRSRCGPPSLLLARARRTGFAVIPGSDPLPRAADAELVGTYGIELSASHAPVSGDRHFNIRELLVRRPDEWRTWGAPNSPQTAVRRFIATL